LLREKQTGYLVLSGEIVAVSHHLFVGFLACMVCRRIARVPALKPLADAELFSLGNKVNICDGFLSVLLIVHILLLKVWLGYKRW
jgi:hypothetical protein